MLTIDESGMPVDQRRRHYLVAFNGEDTTRNRLNLTRMEQHLHAAFGPEACFTKLAMRDGVMRRVLAVEPSDVVVDLVRQMLLHVQGFGWMEQSDFDLVMLPLVHECWKGLPMSDRLFLLEQADLPTSKALEALCPEGLEDELHTFVDEQEKYNVPLG